MKHKLLIVIEVLLLILAGYFICTAGVLWAGGSIVRWGIGAVLLIIAIMWIVIAGKIDKNK